MKEKVKRWRNLIDRIDEKIVSLLNKRICYAKKLSSYKKNPYDPFREREIIEKMKKEKFLPVFREIISVCRGAEGKFKIFISDEKLHPFIVKSFFGESIEYEVLKEKKLLERAELENGFVFMDFKMKNLLTLKKNGMKILWLGSMKIDGKKKKFFLAGKDLNMEILKFPASIMSIRKEKGKYIFSERVIKNPEEIKNLKGEEILGIYPQEEEYD